MQSDLPAACAWPLPAPFLGGCFRQPSDPQAPRSCNTGTLLVQMHGGCHLGSFLQLNICCRFKRCNAWTAGAFAQSRPRPAPEALDQAFQPMVQQCNTCWPAELPAVAPTSGLCQCTYLLINDSKSVPHPSLSLASHRRSLTLRCSIGFPLTHPQIENPGG